MGIKISRPPKTFYYKTDCTCLFKVSIVPVFKSIQHFYVVVLNSYNNTILSEKRYIIPTFICYNFLGVFIKCCQAAFVYIIDSFHDAR